jgi:diguanylate cyclase (GGDEF)-like protein/hemerythrin-like metal-binding protein/PAS domain S-box-containing protein
LARYRTERPQYPIMFDNRTLMLVITLILLSRSALLGYAWVMNRTYTPVRWWALGSSVMAVGVLLVGLRGVVPLDLSVLGGQGLLMAGWMLVSAGTLMAVDRKPLWGWGIGVVVFGMVATYSFLNVSPSYAWRTLVTSLPGLAFDTYTAIACLRYNGNKHRKYTLRLLALALLANGVFSTIKNEHIFHSGVTSPLDPAWEISVYYLVSILVAVACTVFYVLLAAQKLQESLDAELQERARVNASLQVANLLYQATSEGMLVTKADGTITNVNPAFTALSGYAADEVIGKTPRILKSDRHDATFYTAMWRDLQQKGEWKGEIWNRHKNGHLFAEHLTINTLYAPDGSAQSHVALFHDVTRQKLSAEKIFYQANHDRLTDLANRSAFFEQLAVELSRARRAGTRVGLLFMDLNRFKPVNDQYGHEAGDVVLKVASQRWSASIRATDTLARMGGDEFALLVGGQSSVDEIMGIAKKLNHALDQPIDLPGGQQCQLGVSIGIAVYPDHALEMDSLIAAADAAMYICKAKGVGGFALSSNETQTDSVQAGWVALGEADRVGVKVIDEQHGHMIALVNGINRTVMSGKPDEELKVLFQELLAFATEHFATEHQLMVDHHYPGLKAHESQHTHLTEQLTEIFNRFEQGDEMRLLQTTKDWLMGHIQHADKPLGAFLIEKGIT